MTLVFPFRAPTNDGFNPPSAAALWTARVALLGATLVAALLAWSAMASSRLPGCGGASEGGIFDCEPALTSHYSQWFGVPVSALALFVYLLAMLGLVAVDSPGMTTRRSAWRLLLVASTSIVGAAVWFTALLFTGGGLCPWCLAAHLFGLVAVGIVFATYPRAARDAARKPAVLMVAGGCVAVGVLIAGQKLGPERELVVLGVDEGTPIAGSTPAGIKPSDESSAKLSTDAKAPEDAAATKLLPEPTAADNTKNVELPAASADVKNTSGAASGTNETASLDGLAASPGIELAPIESLAANLRTEPRPVVDRATEVHLVPEKRELSMGKNGDPIDLVDFPMVGSRRANFVAVKLFDYTCSHCRSLHQYLELARKRYGDAQFAVVLVPAPLCTDCNKYIKSTGAQHRQACEYARLALAVWKVDYKAFEEFHSYLMDGLEAPDLKEAYRKGAAAVGEQKLRAALVDGWVARRIADNAEIYFKAHSKDRPQLPKLMCGQYMIVGQPKDEKQLFAFFETRWGLSVVAD